MKDVFYTTGRSVRRFANLLKTHRPVRLATIIALLGAVSVLSVQAVPYATSLTNDNGTISFRLNESADNVKIVSNGGATINNLGPLAAGLQTLNLGISGTFQVMVSKASPPGFLTPIAPNRGATLQISTDNNTLRFNNPRGLVVNTDPASPYFGRVYISNSSATNSPRAVGDGIYVLNSDLSDALGQGDSALTGGLDFSESVTHSPYRLAIGRDNNLYVCDWGTNNGSLYVTDPNVSSGSGQNVLGGPIGGPFPVTTSRIHGSIAAAVVEGSLAAGDLRAYVIDEDLQDDPATTTATQRDSLWRHDIGTSLPGPFVLPTRIALHQNAFLRTVGNQVMDLARGPNGNFYVSNYRSVGNEANVWVLDATGALLWNSLTESRTLTGNTTTNDLLRATGGIDVSPAGDVLAVINIETNGITVLPLIDGIPDMTNRLALNGFNTVTGQGREVAFDLAGNLYAASSGAGLLRAFSPGGTTTAITGSDGTFQLIRPPGVSVTATDDSGSESGPDTATFTISRSGDTSADLTVLYTLTGTAVNGTDYVTNTLSALILAGSASVDVTITPIDDNVSEYPETVTLTLLGTSEYDIKPPVLATAAIADNDGNEIAIVAAKSSAYERFPGDTVSFTLTRLGDLNQEVFVDYTTANGTATVGADFDFLPTQFYFAVGVATQSVSVAVFDDSEFEGDETICVTIIPGFDLYTPGTPSNACATLRDNELPAACVLFEDDFENDTSANWIVRFGANNGILDTTATFAHDYSLNGIPPAPRSLGGTTRGVFVQVNKNDPTAGGAAGINLYPAGKSFSGNYALRADMFLSFGTASTTEHALLGLNHSSLLTNRVTQSADANNTTRGGDGIFVAIETDGSANRENTAYTVTNANNVPSAITNRSAASLASLIPAPPYAFAGSPGNGPSSPRTWAEMELSQYNNVIILKVDNNVIYSFTNRTGFTSGDVMIGHSDQFDSVGSAANFVIFDNVRVISLDFAIKSVQLISGNQVQIDFVSPLGGLVSEFHLQSTDSLSAINWTDDNAAVITARGGEGFRAVTSSAPGMRFYRIRR